MMKRALIQGTRICEFVATEADQFEVHPDLQWIEVADDTTEQDTFIDGSVVKYVEPAPTTEEILLGQITVLENEITPRRLREAVLGTDNGWLASKEAEIAAVRAQL